jgi:hypothetical protein
MAGGGPKRVELAGDIAKLVRHNMEKDIHHFHPAVIGNSSGKYRSMNRGCGIPPATIVSTILYFLVKFRRITMRSDPTHPPWKRQVLTLASVAVLKTTP